MHSLHGSTSSKNIVACRPVAGQRPRNRLVQPLLCNRRINKRPFMRNGSVNAFRGTNAHATVEERCFRCDPRRGVIKKGIGATSSVVGWRFRRALQWRLKEMALWFRWQLSSAREAVTRGPERGKLKNLHCWKPLPGNGCWSQQAGRGLAGAVVICKEWRVAIAL
jgi:hypothetical protein